MKRRQFSNELLASFAEHSENRVLSDMAAELLTLRQAFQVPVLWEVQGLYFDKAEDAKGVFPDDEPKPLCYKPGV